MSNTGRFGDREGVGVGGSGGGGGGVGRGGEGGEGSYDNASVNLPGKGAPKKMSRKIVTYVSDPLLMPRINQYLSEHRDKVYIDLNEMVSDLQSRYREYGRRKKNIFRQSVQKGDNRVQRVKVAPGCQVLKHRPQAAAFGIVLQNCGYNQAFPSASRNYSDNSSTDVEECDVDQQETSHSSSNKQVLNLYSSRNPRHVPRTTNRSSTQSAELIDLSSDDETTTPKKEETEELAARTSGNNGMPSTSFTKDPPPHPPNKGPGPDKPERMVPPSRKRKHTPIPGRVPPLPVKEKNPLFLPPKINFSDFGGNPKALEEVCKLILHIQHPELYRKIGLTSPRGFLLHGPPGCGKTLLAAAIAGELKVHFIKVSAPELVGGVSGESEERIRELFENAVEYAPCVLFIDEVDAITPNRQNAQREMERRIVAQLLTCLDELSNVPNGDQVLVIGATNRPDSLDPALRRAGRFDREVCLGIPDLKARQQILKILCKNLKMSPHFSYEEVAMNTPGFVGADLLSLTREAAMIAVNRAFGALQKSNEKKDSKKKKMKLDAKQSPAGKSSSTENARALSSAKNDSANKIPPTGEAMDSESVNKPDDAAREKEMREKGSEDITEKNTLEMEECQKQKIDDDEGMKKKDNETKTSKGKKSESCVNKEGPDMDISETVSEGSMTAGDIEICKDRSMKTVGSDYESEVEVLTANVEAESPDLETLLSWIRCGPSLDLNKLENLSLTQDDFTRALRLVQPSAKREGFATVPDVTWDDVGSLADVREELKMSILGPVKMKKQFEHLGLTAPSGILICGPPGCGKTLLAKAVANEAGINFISVKGPELLNMYVGESERAVRQCFQRARNSAPCVIFFDELDALCPKRSGSGENIASSRVVNQMLTEMDGVEDRKEVYLMAATNRPDIVDPAVLRPGRLDKILYVGLPQEKDRIEILKALTKNGTRPKLARDVDLVNIAERPECNGYSGADLAALVREAGIQALKDLIKKGELNMEGDVEVAEEHFLRALKLIRPSVSAEDRLHYEHLKQKYCSSTSTGF